MAYDSTTVLMSITDIKGQTKFGGYKEYMMLQSFSHGISQIVTTNVSNDDRLTGRPVHQDFSVSKDVDKATPSLLQGCNAGTVYPEVKVVVLRSDGDKVLPLFEYKLGDAVISAMSVGGGGGKPVENIAFNYSKIEWTYTGQKETGGR